MTRSIAAILFVACLGLAFMGLTENAEAGKKYFPPPAVHCIALSHDGKTLAIAEAKGDIRLWDIAKGQNRSSFPVGNSTQEPIRAMAFSPDGKTLALAGHNKRLELWDLSSGKRLVAFVGHLGYATRVLFSPDGKTLFSAGNDGTQREPVGVIRIWDAASGREKAVLRGHRGDITGLSLSADGKLLASACFRGDIKVWDVPTQQEHAAMTTTGIVYSVAIAPDGKRLLSGGQGTQVTIWDVAKKERLGDFKGNKSHIARVAFSADGHLAVSEDSVHTIAIWEVDSLRVLDSFSFDGVFGCVLTPNGATLIGCEQKDGAVKTWDVKKIARGK
jgi:WD40 repeat protein